MKRNWEILGREPVVLFVLLGAVLYALMAVMHRPRAVSTIEIRAETVRALVRQREELQGRPVTAAELEDISRNLIDDEVLLREAYRRGFDRSDDRVRKRLLAVMRSMLDEKIPTPTAAQLQAYYRENADRFRSAPLVSFEQVGHIWGSEKQPKDPGAFLERIESSPDPSSLGDDAPGGFRVSRASRSEIVSRFGPDFADAMSKITGKQWVGPITSRSGSHFVRVLERHPSSTMPFEEVEGYLKQQWMFDMRLAAQRKKLDRLRGRYDIELPLQLRKDSESQ